MPTAEQLEKVAALESSYEWIVSKGVLSKQRTKRTDLSYFDHVDDGVKILEALAAPLVVQKAFCLHPLVQNTTEFVKYFDLIHLFEAKAVALAVEYRWVANLGIRQALKADNWNVTLSSFEHVNQMLVADKVQNRKDFLRLYTPETHPEYDEISHYFNVWLKALDISEEKYNKLVQYAVTHYSRKGRVTETANDSGASHVTGLTNREE